MNASWTGRWPALLAGLSGCLLLAAAPAPANSGLPLFAAVTGHGREYHGTEWGLVLAPIVAIGLSLFLLRRWPYLIVAGGLLSGWALVAPDRTGYLVRLALETVPPAFALIGVLAGAQSLLRRGAAGLGAALAGLALGARLFGSALLDAQAGWYSTGAGVPHWRYALVVAGLAGAAAALTRLWRAGPDVAGPADGSPWSWRRLRVPLAGTLVLALSVPLSYLSTSDVAALMGVAPSTLQRHPYAEVAMIGAVALLLATGLAALAGLWPLGGALTVATAQAAVVTPLSLAFYALQYDGTARWVGALAGVALGAGAVLSRWRVAAAGGLTVAAATALFIAYAATTGHPERLGEQHRVVPGLVILVLVVAAGTAVTAAACAPLAGRGAVPAVLGPLAGVLAVAGSQTLQATYLESNGLPTSSTLNDTTHLSTSALLLLVAGAAVGGLGVAHYLTERWAERRRAEEIRREAAAAERDRLARPIHDGVLQVLAMVQRQDGGSDLAVLAGEQEAALRRLLAGGGTLVPDARPGDRADLRAALTELAAPGIEVAAPAEAVPLAEATAGELVAAVRAALDNVRRHAGDGARTWILLEDEGDGVRVTVRDDGAGIPAGRLDEAERDGRLGVAQSMRGRITDLHGTMTVESRPGDGTEVEFWVPR
ncbi:ATP-binding protein [Actinoplanes sp. L3-i22]|uniref:sensor histidine kinase n=1 Tax=Actinoplanes sp. L3-i22 TaxID=2836373 RepID=UPI001C84FAE7|nr:ATP-binding protein [Actinoplanes sp. L3-i22]